MITKAETGEADGRRLHFVVPGALSTRTGGYAYDRHIIDALRRDGWKVIVHELASCFPWPDSSAREMAALCLDSIDDEARVVVDGLALGVLPELTERLGNRLDLTALVHHPLALESGLTDAQIAQLTDLESRALQHVRRIVVTSAQTRENLRQFGVQPQRCRVVTPGTDAAEPAAGAQGDAPELLCVASVTARKGHEFLVSALHKLAGLKWHLRCIGSTMRDPETVARVQALITQFGLENRITLAGELDDQALDHAYHDADVFVLASLHEGYGMVFDEAIARGLPIVASEVGALTSAVPPAARLTVSPGDTEQLAEALRVVIEDKSRRQEMRLAALAHASSRRDWQQAGTDFSAVLTDTPT